jgi:hypothetical protein
MGKINIGRVLLGGIVAGIVSDLLGTLVDGYLLAPKWTAGMARLGHGGISPNQWVWLNLIGIAGSIAMIWIYAAIRPRFGAGPKTAILAGLVVWFLGTLLPNVSFMWVTGFFGRRLTALTTAGGLIEVVAGALVGAALYKES